MAEVSTAPLFYHAECGWIGPAEEMDADCAMGGEAWSNWICPGCRQWLRLEDYDDVPAIRLERCAGSGDLAHGHGHLCPCGQMFPAPAGAEGGPWPIPEHDGECSW